MKINPEVLDAIKNNKPVVALESTIISHGMPYPKNVACALEVEKVIRENGAIPATIGIINGEPIIGMTNDEIEEFGKRKGIIKCSRRDLPIIISEKEWGAATVSATMILANLAGIEFFVTGGIGGVHRGAQETFDISADLDERGRTNVTVICAGPKAILDLNLTMEYLETKGVPVPEDYSMDPNYINKEIDKAIDEMNKLGIKGKEETPFLLSKIVELTNGKSLEANIKLILNNAALGAKAAIEYCKLRG